MLKDIMLDFCKLQKDIDQFAEAAKLVVNEVIFIYRIVICGETTFYAQVVQMMR